VSGRTWGLFDRVAAEYDEVVPFFARYGVAIVAALAPAPGTRFLDLGAGRGALTGPALDRGCAVTAVDAAPQMARRTSMSYPGARACIMDAQALAFPSASFDLVAAAFVIHVLDNPGAGAAEAYRVLAPGGRFALTGNSSQSQGERPDDPALVDTRSLGSRLDALFAEFTACLQPGGSMGHPIDPADLLTEAGFIDLREDRVMVTVNFPDNHELWRWAMSHGYRAFIEGLPEERRYEFRARMLTLASDEPVLRRGTGVWSGRKPG
jgi:SAM-dependent methyltransferase